MQSESRFYADLVETSALVSLHGFLLRLALSSIVRQMPNPKVRLAEFCDQLVEGAKGFNPDPDNPIDIAIATRSHELAMVFAEGLRADIYSIWEREGGSGKWVERRGGC